jgi:hypothetical protein
MKVVCAGLIHVLLVSYSIERFELCTSPSPSETTQVIRKPRMRYGVAEVDGNAVASDRVSYLLSLYGKYTSA